MISKEQIKAARAMLDWSQKVLAEKCSDVSEPTIKLIESGKVKSTETTLSIIKRTLENAGLEFMPQNGVRFRDDLVTVIEKMDERENIYARLLDDIYYTVQGRYGEVLFSFVNQALSPQEIVDRQLMIRESGTTMRFLVRHGDTFLRYPLDEYRYLPKGSYINNSIVVYGDKIAFVINRLDKIIIIHDADAAEIKRMEFNMIWNIGEKPTESTAEKRYV